MSCTAAATLPRVFITAVKIQAQKITELVMGNYRSRIMPCVDNRISEGERHGPGTVNYLHFAQRVTLFSQGVTLFAQRVTLKQIFTSHTHVIKNDVQEVIKTIQIFEAKSWP